MKKLVIFYLSLALVFSSAGCWSRTELDKITFVLGVAIDREQELYHITVLSTDPTKKEGGEQGGGAAKYTISSAKGKSIFDAARNLTLVIPRRNYWAHCKLIVVNADYAKEKGIKEVLDFFTRDHSRRRTAYLVVTPGKSDDIFRTPAVLDEFPSREIMEIIQQAKASGKNIDMPLYKFIAESQGITGTSMFTYVTRKGKDKQAEGAAIFRDLKMIGLINPTELRGVNWLKGNVRKGVVVFPTRGEGQDDTTVELQKVSHKLEPQLTEEGGRVQVKIKVTGMLVEYGGSEKIIKEEALKEMEESFSNQIKKEILQAWSIAQTDLKADVFLLGDKFGNKYHYLLETTPEQWLEIFQNLELELEIETKITSLGMRREPVLGR